MGVSLGSISVWAGDGWISADSAGFALLWGYLTGGGGSTGGSGGGIGNEGGGQNPQPVKRAGDAAMRLEVFLHDHQDCEQAIDSAIDKAGGGVRANLQELFSKTSFGDWQDHANESLFALGLSPPAPDFSDMTPLRLVLGRNTTRFSALTNPATRTVYLGWFFNRSTDEGSKNQIIVHELLHVAFGNHVQVAKALGLKRQDGSDYTDNDSASNAVDAWLNGGCY